MKTKNITSLAALVLLPALFLSSALAGPGPQDPPTKRSTKQMVVLVAPKVKSSAEENPKAPVITTQRRTAKRPTLLTAGETNLPVWH